MPKNELFYKKLSLMQNCFKKLNNKKKKLNIFSKFNPTRNSSAQNNKTSSNFVFFKINSIKSYNDSKESHNNRNETLFSSKRTKNDFIKTIQMDENYLRMQTIKNKRDLSSIHNLKNNSQFFHSFHSLYIPNRKKRNDLVKTKFLLGKINYYKRIFNFQERFIAPYNTNDISSFKLNIKSKIFSDEVTKSNTLCLHPDDINIKSLKNTKENFSFPTIRKTRKRNEKKDFKFITIKLKKDNWQNTNDILSDIEINNNLNKNDINNENNNSTNYNEKLFEDNYNDLLNNENKKSNKINSNDKYEMKIRKRIKNLKNKLLIYDKKDIYKNIKRIDPNENNNSKLNFNDNKIANKIIKLRKIVAIRKNNMKDGNKNIIIDNPLLRKKLIIV